MTDDLAHEQALQAIAAWLSAPVTLQPLGEGHINDTWLVSSAAGRFVLQRLSAAVFPNPREVAAKVARVVDHLERGGQIRVPALMATVTGAQWHEDARGVWRLWRFADGTRTLERLTSPAQAEAAGAAFGRFQVAIAGLQGEVAEPIPGFLRLPRYLAELDAAASEGSVDREVQTALAVVDRRRSQAAWFCQLDRLIHGDCKINNLLFHAQRDAVVGIIDLDTVMKGHWAWDFGDLVRSAAADGECVNVQRFAAIARGFVQSGALARDDPQEVSEALVLAPRHLALMLGVRFLTDHLRGDRYFKVAIAGENLARARRQLALLEDMEQQARAMAAAVVAVSRGPG